MAMIKPPPEEPEDMDWIFSYADLMTMLLGFFIILYSFSVLDDNKFNSLRDVMTQTFSGKRKNFSDNFSPVESDARKLRTVMTIIEEMDFGEDLDTILNKVESDQINQKDMKNIEKVIESKLKIESGKKSKNSFFTGQGASHFASFSVPFNSLFLPGSSTLTRNARVKLTQFSRVSKGFNDIELLEVVGHTDSSTGARTSNLSLSAERAAVVAEFLMTSGFPENKIKSSGVGSTYPLFEERDSRGRWIRENMAKNRRISLILHRNTPPVSTRKGKNKK